MKKAFLSLSVAAVLVVFFALNVRAAAPVVNLSNQTGDVKVINASVVIDAPPEAVWQTLTDYNNLNAFMPGYEKSRVIGGSGAVKTLEMGLKVSRMLPAFHYQASVRENKTDRTLSIQRISGDFKAFNASYKLLPANNGSKTQLVYSLALDAGVGVPKLGVDHILKSSTEKTLSAVQSYCAAAYRKSVLAAAK